MIQIRKNVFETNSSSTHSLVMCSEPEFNDWKEGKTYICEWGLWGDLKERFSDLQDESFYPKNRVDETLKDLHPDADEDELSEIRREYFKTYDEFFDNEYLEPYSQTYTTKGGEKVYAFGMYGYDG